jgi:hypothetical protein
VERSKEIYVMNENDKKKGLTYHHFRDNLGQPKSMEKKMGGLGDAKNGNHLHFQQWQGKVIEM